MLTADRLADSHAGDASPAPSEQSAPRRTHRRVRALGRLKGEGGLVAGLAFTAYLVVAILLDFVYHTLPGDAVSRMANGFYVLYSRDPHLAAMGFVWTPLTSIADMVPLLGKDLWPALASHDFAGSLVTVFSMTGAVHQLRSALREWGVRRGARLTVTALFALNPMILFFAANGMSEALYLFALVAGTRYLLRWVRQDDARSLAFAAISLGLGYLARNETTGAAFLATLVVFAVSYSRAASARRTRQRLWRRHQRASGSPSLAARHSASAAQQEPATWPRPSGRCGSRRPKKWLLHPLRRGKSDGGWHQRGYPAVGCSGRAAEPEDRSASRLLQPAALHRAVPEACLPRHH